MINRFGKIEYKLMRINKGLTQEQLAKELGITVNYLSLIENYHRDPSWKVFNKMCEVLGFRVVPVI